MLHPSLRSGRSFGMPAWMASPLPYFGRTAEARSRRRRVSAFDEAEERTRRNRVFAKIWREGGE